MPRHDALASPRPVSQDAARRNRRLDAPVAPPAHASAADIPSVDRLLSGRALAPLVERFGRPQTTAALRAHLDVLRAAAPAGSLERGAVAEDAITAAVETSLLDAAKPRLRRVFNLTGTVLHTNLGRAVLPAAAARALADAATSPVNLEFDLAAGRRGDRDALVEPLLCEL